MSTDNHSVAPKVNMIEAITNEKVAKKHKSSGKREKKTVFVSFFAIRS